MCSRDGGRLECLLCCGNAVRMSVSADVISSEELVCITPSYSQNIDNDNAVVVAMLYISGRATGSSKQSVAYAYTPLPVVKSLTPLMGPLRGAEALPTQGTGFVAGDMYCRFGHIPPVQATYLREKSTSCVPPQVSMPQSVRSEVSTNGIAFSSSEITLTHHRRLTHAR